MSLHSAIREALRTALMSVVRCTTGSRTDIAVTSTGYTRQAGSFLADGFVVGDEITGVGFADAANNLPRLVVGVTATTVTVVPGTTALVVRGVGGAVTLRCGLPTTLSTENLAFEPQADRPYVQDFLIPGNSAPISIGPKRRVQHDGLYQVDVYYPGDVGPGAQDRMVDAILETFYPGLLLAAQGQQVTVLSARRAQSLPVDGGAKVPVTVTYRTYTITPQ